MAFLSGLREFFPVVPYVRTIEILAWRNSFPIPARILRPAPGQRYSLRQIHGTAKSDRPILEIRLS